MTGRRQPDGTSMADWAPGDYGRWRDRWYAKVPSGELGNLGAHVVTEHEDGTITVSPSIECTGEKYWHGFLERGNWRSV